MAVRGLPTLRSTLEGIGSRRARLDTLFLALVSLCVLSSACARAGGEAFQPTHSTPLPLAEGTTVGQSFTSPGGVVAGIDLVTATYGAPADPEGTLRVVLLDGPGGRRLGEQQVSGGELGDSAWLGVTFPSPVAVPERAALAVAWTGATPVALFANAPRDGEVAGDELANDPYPGGQLLLDGEPAAGDLAFRVRGTGGVAAAIDQAAEVAASAGGRLPEQPLFAVGWLAAVAGAASLAVAGFRGGRRRQRRRR